MFRRILVGDNERVFVIRKRRFAGILAAGEYWIFTLGRGVELERHNDRELILSSEWTDTLARQFPELAARHFTLIETGESQVAIFALIDVRAEPEVPTWLVSALARLGENRAALVTHRRRQARTAVSRWPPDRPEGTT
jgi:hypothetical protein